MKVLTKIMMLSGLLAITAGCGQKKDADFKYLLDEFADLKIIRYQIPGWDELSLQQKEYAYHLAEAAKWGRDIYWDQNCAGNIELRHVLENILENYTGDRKCEEYNQFLVYAKRIFFANGIHHHYSEDKIFPACSEEYFRSLMESVGDSRKADATMAFVYDKQEVFREEIKEAVRSFARLTSVEIAGIILNAGAIAHLANHFQVVFHAFFQSLCFMKASAKPLSAIPGRSTKTVSHRLFLLHKFHIDKANLRKKFVYL